MKSMLRSFYTKPLIIYLAVSLLAISAFAGYAEAMFVPAAPSQQDTATTVSADRAADLARIQTALESKIVRQRLQDYGLSSEEALARIHTLSDSQVHQFAAHTDSLQAGGDPVDTLIGLLLVALLVVVLIYLLQGRIQVK